jgi:hypothetical protein
MALPGIEPHVELEGGDEEFAEMAKVEKLEGQFLGQV